MLVNQDDPVKASLVDDRIQALITEANLLLSRRISDQAASYLDLLIKGGQFSLPLIGDLDILGLQPSSEILRGVRAELPPDSDARAALDRVIRFSDLARENLDFALPLLGAVSSPIEVEKVVVAGQSSELDVFAIAVAATVTLMFVTVLLVAGSLALEREENVFARITRGLVGVTGLLTEKVVLGIIASFAVTLLLLAALTALVSVDWGRAPLILVAIGAGGAGFAAFGAAIGASAKEVRASSLLAFMASLPIAFLSLVPVGNRERRASFTRSRWSGRCFRSTPRSTRCRERSTRPARTCCCPSCTCSRSCSPTGCSRAWRCGALPDRRARRVTCSRCPRRTPWSCSRSPAPAWSRSRGRR